MTNGWVERVLVVLAVLTLGVLLAFLARTGQYYLLPLWERPDSAMHPALRPSGTIGHLLGIVGATLMLVGVSLYSARKRIRLLQGKGAMRTWLNVHIYLCLTGPLLVTLHTALKFGGFAAWSWWSMIMVAASGMVGRWIYQQFPRTIRGRELTLAELREEQDLVHDLLERAHGHSRAALERAASFAEQAVARLRAIPGPLLLPALVADDAVRPFRMLALRRRLRRGRLPEPEVRAVSHLIHDQLTVARRIAFLALFRRLFLYWHVTHLVFFVAMIVLLVLHVATAIMFGAGMGAS